MGWIGALLLVILVLPFSYICSQGYEASKYMGAAWSEDALIRPSHLQAPAYQDARSLGTQLPF